MPYVERRVTAGKVIEVDRYYTGRWHAEGVTRGVSVKPTQEAQKRINTRKAERTLRILLNANFVDGDLHLDVGYIRNRFTSDRTREEMREDARQFLRELRKVYKKSGHILKYIHVMEEGSKGARHHHFVINQPGIDTRLIQQAWNKVYEGRSKIHFSPLDTKGDYSRLASYLIKYTSRVLGTEEAMQGKRYNCSRNLIRPEPEYKIIKNRNQFSREPKCKKGYYIDKDSIECGISNAEYFGFEYLHYRMVRLN